MFFVSLCFGLKFIDFGTCCVGGRRLDRDTRYGLRIASRIGALIQLTLAKMRRGNKNWMENLSFNLSRYFDFESDSHSHSIGVRSCWIWLYLLRVANWIFVGFYACCYYFIVIYLFITLFYYYYYYVAVAFDWFAHSLARACCETHPRCPTLDGKMRKQFAGICRGDGDGDDSDGVATVAQRLRLDSSSARIPHSALSCSSRLRAVVNCCVVSFYGCLRLTLLSKNSTSGWVCECESKICPLCSLFSLPL